MSISCFVILTSLRAFLVGRGRTRLEKTKCSAVSLQMLVVFKSAPILKRQAPVAPSGSTSCEGITSNACDGGAINVPKQATAPTASARKPLFFKNMHPTFERKIAGINTNAPVIQFD